MILALIILTMGVLCYVAIASVPMHVHALLALCLLAVIPAGRALGLSSGEITVAIALAVFGGVLAMDVWHEFRDRSRRALKRARQRLRVARWRAERYAARPDSLDALPPLCALLCLSGALLAGYPLFASAIMASATLTAAALACLLVHSLRTASPCEVRPIGDTARGRAVKALKIDKKRRLTANY